AESVEETASDARGGLSALRHGAQRARCSGHDKTGIRIVQTGTAQRRLKCNFSPTIYLDFLAANECICTTSSAERRRCWTSRKRNRLERSRRAHPYSHSRNAFRVTRERYLAIRRQSLGLGDQAEEIACCAGGGRTAPGRKRPVLV